MNNSLRIQPVEVGSDLWKTLTEYADACSWSAGKSLAQQMRANDFGGWARIFAALAGNEIAGYCTFAEKDCIPHVPYTPYIGYMFVGEPYRGKRLSGKLIHFVLDYAKKQGFHQVYLVSDHINLYEKYGFVKADEKPAPWNPDQMETIFMHDV